MHFDLSFNGEGNANDFLRKLETFSPFNAIAGYVKIKCIWSALAGKAKEWIEVTLNPIPNTSYNEIKDALLLAFSGDDENRTRDIWQASELFGIRPRFCLT